MSSFKRTPPALKATSLEGSYTSNNTFGTEIVKKEHQAKVHVYKPSWNQTETIIRPYPSLSYENADEFESYRVDPTGSCGMGNWIRRYEAAVQVGQKNKRTFLLAEPGTGTNISKLPLNVLHERIKALSAYDDHAKFLRLFTGDATSAAALTLPKYMYLIQGLLLVHKSKPKYGINERGYPELTPGAGNAPSCIFQLSSSVGKKLTDMLNEENPEYTDPYDFESRFKYGNPLDLNHGRFFVFREEGSVIHNSFLARPKQGKAPAGAFRGNQQQQRGGKSFKGYDVEIVDYPLHDGYTPQMNDPKTVQDVKNHWVYWEDVLWFPTAVEQARELNEVFDPEVIVLGFQGSDPDWITEETWKRYRGSVTVPVEASVERDEEVPSYGKMSPEARKKYLMDDPFGNPVSERKVPPSRQAGSILDNMTASKPSVFRGDIMHPVDTIVPSSIPGNSPDVADTGTAMSHLSALIRADQKKS